MSEQLSVTDILKSVEGLESTKFEQLYRALFTLRVQRKGLPLLNPVETHLLNKINNEFDPKKWERLTYQGGFVSYSVVSPILFFL